LTKRVIVSSQDFRLAYKVQISLPQSYSFEHRSPSNEVKDADIVITTREEFDQIWHPHKLALRWDYSISRIKSEIISLLVKHKEQRICLVGIDPGKAIGISILFQNEVVHTTVVTSLKQMLFWMNEKITGIQHDLLIIKVGNGGGQMQSEIITTISQNFHLSASIELVDERNTSVKGNQNLSIHEEAAIKIARRGGKSMSG
jgi:hypothetical protein